jgi:hypothetical protein
VFRPGQAISAAHLRNLVSERIPDYMIPRNTVVLDALPRLPNGKLDRRMLPAPDRGKESAESSTHESADDLFFNATESAIAKVFHELLHTNRIGVDQRFFDLCAHSLLLVKAQRSDIGILEETHQPKIRIELVTMSIMEVESGITS